jgi:hypothetical protein
MELHSHWRGCSLGHLVGRPRRRSGHSAEQRLVRERRSRPAVDSKTRRISSLTGRTPYQLTLAKLILSPGELLLALQPAKPLKLTTSIRRSLRMSRGGRT